MSAPVDIPQNIHIHVAPAEKVQQAKQPEPGNNHSQDFQDFFERSAKDKIHREEKQRREKDQFQKKFKPENVQNAEEYDSKGEQPNDDGPDNLNLGHNVDMLA